jgi:DNA helicase II / ATP-dependent DNA helicase PcrA
MANLDLKFSPDDRSQAFRNHVAGYLISLAGPGTGKTTSLLERIKALREQKVPQSNICYLTFIGGITNAFIDDYIEEFGKESFEANKPRISTLHSFACRLVRHQGFRIGYEGELYFGNTTEKHSDAANTILSDLLPFVRGPECRTVAQLRNRINSLKSAWQNSVDPTTLAVPNPTILHYLTNLFRAFRILDWDQSIPLAHELVISLQPFPDWIADIKHYLIDEFQDFNKAEQALISFLSAKAISTVIVGDDDQSLYSGRGGSPDGLLDLYHNLTHDQVSLIKCFRCRKAIVTAANTFQRTMHATPRNMLSVKDGGQVVAYRFKSAKAECAYLTQFLQDSIACLPDSPGPKDGTVCLFPDRKVLASYFDRLSPHIPCSKIKTDLDPDRVWLELILRLVLNPNQRFRERLLLNHYGAIKPKHKKLLVEKVVEGDISVVSALRFLIADGGLSGQAAVQSQEFCQLIEHIVAKVPDAIAYHVASKLAIDSRTVANYLTEMLAKADAEEHESLVAQYCDLMLPETKLPIADSRCILFLTMHGSKGLTKKNVVIPGMETAWMPARSDGLKLKETQRLFYVAITRATDRVLITFPQTRAGKDCLNFPTPGRGIESPFIAGAGLTVAYHS